MSWLSIRSRRPPPIAGYVRSGDAARDPHRGSAFDDDVDPAVIDRRIARPGLSYRLLPDHCPRDAVRLELVRDDRAARLREIFVRLGRARSARARLNDDRLGLPRPLRGIGDRGLCFIGQIRAEFVKIYEEPRQLGGCSIRRRLRASCSGARQRRQ